MDRPLNAIDHHKVVFITGAARRVGAAIARRLHAQGARVVLHHRDSASEAQALANQLNAVRADSARCIQADLLQADFTQVAKEAQAQFGQIDALVNNASSFYPTAIGEVTATAWDDLVGTNLKAPLFLAQALAPTLAQRRGVIVNIVDIHAERPLRGYVVYSLAKAGLAALTRSLAMELAPQVRVNGVAPGAIAWPDDGQFSQTERERIIADTLLERLGEPEDIARAVAFFVNDAPYVTGQILAVDGGRSVNI
jgi:pteridine reductase